MRTKSIVLVVMAIGCGVVAAIGVTQLMDARSRQQGAEGETQPVFVALTDIGANEELTAQNIKLEEWPKNHLPPGALTRLDEVEGKRARMRIYAGEPVLSSKLVGAADAVGAAKDIPAGYRVAHVKIDTAAGSSNLILPGDRVDVLLFRQPPNGNDANTKVAKVVLQDIKVFAVDTHTETEFSKNKNESGDPITAKTISLLVTPQQALILHAASEISGSIRLVLRNPEDDAHVAIHAATMGDIFGSDQQSERDQEQAGGESTDKDDLADFLKKQQAEKAAREAKPEPPSETTAAITPLAAHRHMTVILGSAIRQVELPDDGQIPADQPSFDPAAGGGCRATREAD